jgi:hypothetical protein
MNTKLLQEQQALLAIASKTTQRTTLFLHACSLIQEQQNVIARLVDHIGQLNIDALTNETKRTANSVDTAISTTAPSQS